MNCKPNSLALIVRNTSEIPCFETAIGTLVQVTQLLEPKHPRYGPVWRLAGTVCCSDCKTVFDGYLDADLQMLRPPGLTEAITTNAPVEVSCPSK